MLDLLIILIANDLLVGHLALEEFIRIINTAHSTPHTP